MLPLIPIRQGNPQFQAGEELPPVRLGCGEDQLYAGASWSCALAPSLPLLSVPLPLRGYAFDQSIPTGPLRQACACSECDDLCPASLMALIFPSPLTPERVEIREASL